MCTPSKSVDHSSCNAHHSSILFTNSEISKVVVMQCFYYLSLFFSFSIVSLAQTNTDSFAQTNTPSIFYFPLKAGNLWQYKEPPPPEDPFITEVRAGRETTFSNGQTYRRFATYDSFDVRYERQMGSKIFRYFLNQQTEFLIYDFSKNVGDTVSVFNNPSQFGSDTSIVTVLDIGTQNIFGKSKKYVTFFNRLIHATYYWIDQITDSLGITFSQIEPGYQLYLVGTIIDSVRYGVVTNVLTTEKEIPTYFTLFQNFPNPFNPSTTIAFKVPNGKQITLIIYNVLGERLRTLYAGYGNGDTQKIVWDRKNDVGIRVSSGVYFYQIRSESFTATKKMLLVQ